MSVEKIYQKKTQLEHILLRPDTYIGSIEPQSQEMWVYDDVKNEIVSRTIRFVPGLYKIFDEILVNAADNKQRDPTMKSVRVTIDRENGTISVYNDGRGIPIQVSFLQIFLSLSPCLSLRSSFSSAVCSCLSFHLKL